MPRVSVIVPTYGREKTVLEAVHSVLDQTYRDFELLVVNDGSPDGTRERLAPLAASRRIRYLEQPNRGRGFACNAGLAAAQGEYVAYLDDDDAWLPDKLAWQVPYLDAHPETVVVGGSAVNLETGEALGAPAPERLLTFASLFGKGPYRSCGCALIRGAPLRAEAGFDAGLWGADDLDLWFRLARHGNLACLPRPALRYRLHPGSMSTDLCRMMLNADMVFRRHLAALPQPVRQPARVGAYRWLFDYAGERVLLTGKAQLYGGEWRAAWRKLRSMRIYLLACLGSREFARQFLREVLPARFTS